MEYSENEIQAIERVKEVIKFILIILLGIWWVFQVVKLNLII